MDAEAQADLIARNAEEPLIEPGPGETKEVCGMSRTGWAVVTADGACTCKPCTPPVKSIAATWRRLVYLLHYRLHLWRIVPGMTLLEAMKYPAPYLVSDGDPIEDAEAEYDAMKDSL